MERVNGFCNAGPLIFGKEVCNLQLIVLIVNSRYYVVVDFACYCTPYKRYGSTTVSLVPCKHSEWVINRAKALRDEVLFFSHLALPRMKVYAPSSFCMAQR